MIHPVNAKRPQERRRRVLLATLFLVYLVLLTWVVMWKLEMPWVGGGVRNVKLVPFVTGSNGDGASQPIEVWANLLLFVPFGVYLRLLAPSWSPLSMTALAVGVSGAMEAAQFVLAVGRTDSSDVIANTAGAAVGIVLFALVQHGIGPRARRLMTRACLAGTAVALVACGLFVSGPIRYGPPDVRCDSQGSCRVGHDLDR
ncbi:VanZ family protein [Knoellia sp. CPCC 206453]|uniref:VanZ family protein n=1 Tax=Knoellia pratensis TaxID=3404796 RepID=UPI003611CAA2